MYSEHLLPSGFDKLVLGRNVRLDEQFAELLELLGPSDFLGEEGQLDDMEELVVEFVCFG